MRLPVAFLLLSFIAVPANAAGIVEHFLDGACRFDHKPVVIVTDVTTAGEIDDSISLLMYRELEKRDCIRVVGIVSIFGNGGLSTERVHRNLTERIDELGLTAWRRRILRGPDRTSFNTPNDADIPRLRRIAGVVERYPDVVIVELGPWTVSATLLMNGLVDPSSIAAILGVRGREPGERFTTGRTLIGSLFAFRDMNVAEDTKAISYLLRHHPAKLWLMTYQTGIGSRTVDKRMIASFEPELATHAEKRWRTAHDLLGYSGIPLWDAWTTSYFLHDGPEALECRKMSAAMRYDDSGFRDPMQLHLGVQGASGGSIVACH